MIRITSTVVRTAQTISSRVMSDIRHLWRGSRVRWCRVGGHPGPRQGAKLAEIIAPQQSVRRKYLLFDNPSCRPTYARVPNLANFCDSRQDRASNSLKAHGSAEFTSQVLVTLC